MKTSFFCSTGISSDYTCVVSTITEPEVAVDANLKHGSFIVWIVSLAKV